MTCLLFGGIVYGQNVDSLSLIRTKQIVLTEDKDTILLDKYSIVPESVVFSKNKNNFNIEFKSAQLFEINNTQLVDTISVQYRVFPFLLNETSSNLTKYIPKKDSLSEDNHYVIQQNNEDIFDFGELQIDGGLNRALNFGNAQNLVVNSNLNLRLSGTVADDVKIEGVLTDSNVPFQPQGNSQQIRELDQVFLQFTKDNHQVTLGDYEYRKPTSYFLNFDKRLQGANYLGEFTTNSDWKITTSNSGAVSRGKYAQNQFTGSEGNQGPYKLYGANNETFIIILAGTEQVFIDGIKQERGLDQDYTIDYNTGEITFTSQNLITNRSRIAIEFEYTDQSYNSSLFFSETELKKNKLAFRVNLYTEQDSKNKITLSDTTLNTRGLFNNIGDSSNEFFTDSYEQVVFNPNRIQYKLTDSLTNGVVYDSVFVYSRNANIDLYNVIFTYVGENNGDYVVENRNTNGRVYRWVAPINGQNRGNYLAQIRLRPPSQRQMASLTTTYNFSTTHSISLETSFSNKDLNTLSTIGNNDNQGFAGKIGWNKKFFTGKDSTSKILQATINYELKDKQFRAIERYRPIEFSRDWNANTNVTDSLTEGYGQLQLAYKLSTNKKFSYTLSQFNQESLYSGLKHTATANIAEKGWTIKGNFDYLSASQQEISSSFSRPLLQVEKQINKFLIGTKLRQNIRKFEDGNNSNYLTASSIGDQDYSVYLSTADTTKIPITISYNKHYDSTPFETKLKDVFDADEWQITGALRKSKIHKANFIFTHRTLNVLDTTLTTERGKTSLLGKFNYSGNYLKGVIRTGFDYEIGSGREPKREFSYIQVANGEGVYTWNDYNDNGIQEVTEFEVAPFSDQAEYVRVFTNSTEYINADTGRLNQWLQLDPAIAWRKEKGIKNTLSRLSINANLTLNTKLYEDAPGARFNPYTFSVSRDGLVASSNRMSGRVVYNKLSNKFRSTYIYQENDSKNQLLSGFEQREKKEHSINNIFYLKNKLTLQIETGLSNNTFYSENYTQKTFNFDQYFAKPQLSWVYKNQLRLTTGYELSQSENIAQFGGQTADINALNFDFNWNKKQKFALQGKFNYNSVSYSGNSNDAVSFSMLNGLQNGKNSLWNLGFERNILESLKVNLTYDGRKLGENQPVHTGRARITAIF